MTVSLSHHEPGNSHIIVPPFECPSVSSGLKKTVPSSHHHTLPPATPSHLAHCQLTHHLTLPHSHSPTCHTIFPCHVATIPPCHLPHHLTVPPSNNPTLSHATPSYPPLLLCHLAIIPPCHLPHHPTVPPVTNMSHPCRRDTKCAAWPPGAPP